MSAQSGLNTSNNMGNISVQVKDREEFIEEFQRQRGYQNASFITYSTPSFNGQRWNYLHDMNKLYQSRLQEKREQQKQIESEKEMEECTFEPKLNKSILYKNNSNYDLKQNNTVNNNNTENSILNLNLIERQDAWIEKRKTKINEKAQQKENDQMKQCFFTPEINNEDATQKAKITRKTVSLLEDPESYSMYIKRLQKKREEDEKKKMKEYLRPGNGNIWERKMHRDKSHNKSYDYTKHEYSRNLSRSKSNPRHKLNSSVYSSKRMKTESSITKLRKKINNGEADQDKLYEEIYKKNIFKISNPYNTSRASSGANFKRNNNETNDISGYTEQDSIYQQPIEYGKAIDILHNALYSIDLEAEMEE